MGKLVRKKVEGYPVNLTARTKCSRYQNLSSRFFYVDKFPPSDTGGVLREGPVFEIVAKLLKAMGRESCRDGERVGGFGPSIFNIFKTLKKICFILPLSVLNCPLRSSRVELLRAKGVLAQGWGGDSLV